MLIIFHHKNHNFIFHLYWGIIDKQNWRYLRCSVLCLDIHIHVKGFLHWVHLNTCHHAYLFVLFYSLSKSQLYKLRAIIFWNILLDFWPEFIFMEHTKLSFCFLCLIIYGLWNWWLILERYNNKNYQIMFSRIAVSELGSQSQHSPCRGHERWWLNYQLLYSQWCYFFGIER